MYRREIIDSESRSILASEMMKYIEGETSHDAFLDVADEIDTKCSDETMHDNLVYKTWFYLVFLVNSCEEYSIDGKFEGDDRLDNKLIELFKQLEACIKTDMLDVPKDLDKKISAVIGLNKYRREERLKIIISIGSLLCLISHVITWVVFYFVEK